VGEEVAVDALGIRDDDHFPSVGGVGVAPDETASFEPVDHTRDGPGGQAGELGDPARWDGSMQQHETQRSEVCRV